MVGCWGLLDGGVGVELEVGIRRLGIRGFGCVGGELGVLVGV